jgi:pyruvate kinase
VSVRPRRARIVATLGPATSSVERLSALIQAGVDVVRLNFSHGTQAEHAERIRLIRHLAAQLGRSVAVLQDLQGPKIRTGLLEGGTAVQLEEGAELSITTQDIRGTAKRFSTTYEALPRDVKPGDSLLLDDGKLRLTVLSSGEDELRARVEHGGRLGEHKGINLPGVVVSAPALTPKDIDDLRFGLAHGVDFVALSFVRTADEVERARELIAERRADVPIIVKLEKPEAVDNLDAILAACDGVMVARGDLGVELPPEKVPGIQKRIIRRANRAGKPVITATQMLESMITSPTPTRAEATDVANAIWDGTDAVMLSAESAVGQFPVEAVSMMDRIVVEAERSRGETDRVHGGRVTHAHAISHAARTLSDELDVRAVVCFTRTGRTANLLSGDRPRVPIIAFTLDERIERRLALRWGVTPILCQLPLTTDALISTMEKILLERELCEQGDNVVLVGAIPLRAGVHTNFLKLHHIG